MNILLCWIGQTDIDASSEKSGAGVGPIATAVAAYDYDHLHLLNNYQPEKAVLYESWLRQRTHAFIHIHQITLTSPTAYAEIYKAASGKVEYLQKKHTNATLTFHLSPGTPAMAAVWIILAKTRFKARLIESSKESGVRIVSIPFAMTAEFLPDQKLAEFSSSRPPLAPAFADIIHQSDQMRRMLEMAQRIAGRDIPVLIEGESGTGKELLARAIHKAGRRSAAVFQAVNCGAIPPELMESTFFGHKKGSFTGAVSDAMGFFREADKGTLFLDEIGELPLSMQVKLLRAVQEKEVVPVGGVKAVAIDVRIIAATNRSLIQEVAASRFRSDLFYRLAVGVLHLPPLRERKGDIELLLDRLLTRINDELGFAADEHKYISADVKNFMIVQPWRGNVRELENTLKRAYIWADGAAITLDDARAAVFPTTEIFEPEPWNCPLSDDFTLKDCINQIAKKHIEQALEMNGGNRAKAAKTLGFSSYQTMNNWLKRSSESEKIFPIGTEIA